METFDFPPPGPPSSKSVTSGIFQGGEGVGGEEQKNQAPASLGVLKVGKENRPDHPCSDRVFS